MIIDKQKGISLILTFFITMLVLAIVLSISVLLYSEVKVLRNIGNSVASFYAAESGIEKVLFYDRQVRLSNYQSCELDIDCSGFYDTCYEGACTAKRGLCSILDACSSEPESGFIPDRSIYCNLVFAASGADCANCTDCTVSFNARFDADNSRTYLVAAKVDENYYLNVASKGIFKGTERQIRTTIPR